MRARQLFAAIAALLTPAVALAQNVPPDIPSTISPLKSEPDPNGVNISDGLKVVDMPVVLSIPADPRLTFDRVQNAAPYITGTISHNDPQSPLASSWSAHFGGQQSESFQCENDDVCHSVTYSGSNISYASRDVLQAGSGVFYAFHTLQSRVDNGTNTQEQRYATTVSYPDGEILTYTYQAGFLSGNPYPACPHIGNCRSFFRPTRIDSNTGYYITIAYQYTGTDVANPLWGVPAQAAIYSPSNVLIRRLVYSGAGGGTVTDYGNNPVNSGGRTFTTTAANALGNQLETANASVTLPGEGSPQLSVVGSNSHGTWTGPLIDSVTRDGVGWTYSYANARGLQIGQPIPANQIVPAYDSVTVNGPNGYHVTYAMSLPVHNYPTMKILSRTDALNHTTSFTYGNGDQLTGITMPEGNSVSIGYGDCGNIVTKTSVAKPGSGLANLVESATYPVAGPPENPCPTVLYFRPTSYTDARGHVFNYSYNSLGQLTQELAPADANGVRRETDITYVTNAAGISRRTQVRVCGQTTSCAASAESRTDFAYFASGDVANTNLPLTVTQRDEATGATRVTTYTYDAAGRPTVIDGPLAGTGDTKYFQYDKFGRKIWEVGELAPNNLRLAKFFTYRDSDDKVVNVQTGSVACTSGCDTATLTLTLLQQTDTTYDSRRYPMREKTYKGATTYTVTDRSFLDRGLAECTTVRMNLAALPAATDHGACALGTQGTQGADRITRNSYDTAGELLKVQKAYLTADQADYVTYTYTSNGKQDFVTDANGNKARFVYDGFDRLYQWQFPSKTTPGVVNTADFEQYGYDANGNRTSLRKRDASTLTYTYDNLNRMTHKGGSIADVDYSYDIAGRQLTARFSTGGQGITNTYNGFGELTSTSSNMGGTARALSYLYDVAGRRTRITHPDGVYFTMGYDALNRMTSGSWTKAGATTAFLTIGYDNAGRRSSLTGGPSANSSTTYGWDDIDRLSSMAQNFVGGAGNLTQTFGYNPASQITTETRDNDAYASLAPAIGSTSYVPNGLNQYSSVGGSALAYDANGNLTSDPTTPGGTTTYGYDAENRLTSATTAGVTTTLSYDPLGRLWRVVKGSSDTRFLYDGDHEALEYDGAGNIAWRYFFGPNGDEPIIADLGGSLDCNNTRFLHLDHLGSMIATNDCSGNRATVARYDEYGLPASTNWGRFQYTGQAWIGEVGLYYYKARMYDPRSGRFLQTDPVGYQDQINLYAYVTDDPVNQSDPAGTGSTDIIVTGARLICDAACETFAAIFKLAPGAAARLSPFLQVFSSQATACIAMEGCDDPDILISNEKDLNQTVEKALESRVGSIKNARLPPGSPSWRSLAKVTLAQVKQRAKEGQTGYRTIWKLLNDSRFRK